MIQYIYRKHRRDRAALTGVITSYRTKSALRNVGKALGLQIETVERLATTAYGIEGQWISDACLVENGLDRSVRGGGLWVNLANAIGGFYRQHTGGFIIARDKLSRLVPVENAAMDDRTLIQGTRTT